LELEETVGKNEVVEGLKHTKEATESVIVSNGNAGEERGGY
jgi:hypothetical protein